MCYDAGEFIESPVSEASGNIEPSETVLEKDVVGKAVPVTE